MVRSAGIRETVLAEVPALAMSLLIAEAGYKFHSFTLECLAFLATWFVVSSLFVFVRKRWFTKEQTV
jgi:hypothetical protein